MKNYILYLSLMIAPSLWSQTNPGILSGSATVCQGSNSGVISLSSYSGTIQRWECAPSPGGPWVSIVFTLPAYSYSNLPQTTCFRAVVQLTGYSEATSNVVQVSTEAPTVAGIIQGPSSACVNSPVSLNLSGHTGSIVCWEYSQDAWVTTNTLTTANIPQVTLTSLTAPTQFRCRVKSGACPQQTTPSLPVQADSQGSAGTVTGAQTVCAMGNSGTLSLNGFTGTILRWETAFSPGGPFYSVNNIQPALSYSNLAQNFWFRAVVKNGACEENESAPAKIAVDATTSPGYITGTSSVCAGTNAGQLTLFGNNGPVTSWEQSSDGTTWSAFSHSLSTYGFINLSATRLYRAKSQNGVCPMTASAAHTVYVHALPTASFNVNSGCASSPVTFSNLSQGAVMFTWDFSNGGSSSAFSPPHTFNSPATYTVKLSATSNAGCTDSLRKTVAIHPLPVAGFVSVDTTCFGSGLTFQNASSISAGTISGIMFHFGDGSSSGLNTTSHTYAAAGGYHVKLVVTSGFGCTDSIQKTISVLPRPVALFQANNVCQGTAVQFLNNSFVSAGPLSYSWAFGNGQYSAQQHASCLYPGPGLFPVRLIASSMHGCADTVFANVAINEKPQVDLTVRDICQGATATFTAAVSPSTLQANSLLEFGDGSSGTLLNASHVYDVPGKYKIQFTAVSDSGCTTTIAKYITVAPRPLAAFSAANTCAGDSLRLQNLSFMPGGTMSFSWTSTLFISTDASPRLAPDKEGSHIISLQAISDKQCRDTAYETITVYPRPEADFGFSNACDGNPVQFTNSSRISTGTLRTFLWDFGDNSLGTQKDPGKQFLLHGTYTVMLVTGSDRGCMDTAYKMVMVDEAPLANFSALNACLGEEIKFNNSSELSTGTYESAWQFGEGSSSSVTFPVHEYKSPGDYLVRLRVTSTAGCIDSVMKYVTVHALPEVHAGTDTLLEKGTPVTLRASGATAYLWYPPEGLDNPLSAAPLANPPQSATFIVFGTDGYGCASSDTILVRVKEEFDVFPYNLLTPDGNGLNDTWIVRNIASYPDNEVRVFSQWNQQVYARKNYSNEWDGRNQEGELLPDGTYYYLLRFAGSDKQLSGYITLMRNK